MSCMQKGHMPTRSPLLHHTTSSSAPAAAGCRRAALADARASPSALHTCLCPACQSACEQAVPQYRTARQPLRVGSDRGISRSDDRANRSDK